MAKGPSVADLRLYLGAADGGELKAESVMGTKRFRKGRGFR